MSRFKRNGFSLIEVMAVTVVLAVAAIATQMLAPMNSVRSMEATTESRKLIAALRMARMTAIHRQVPVQVRFLGAIGRISGYVLEEQNGGSFVSLAPNENLVMHATASSNAMSIVFAPNGTADRALQLTIGTGRQNHTITVASGTGMVSYVRR